MADEDDTTNSSFLDENGRLFGLVNIVDLLVVLLVLAVVAAGAALLLGGSGEQDTRYATIDLGPQSDFVAEQIGPGDEFEPEGTSDSITVTDVYRFDQDGETHVIVRAAINGTTVESDDPDDVPTFEFRGEPLRLGQTLPIETPDYGVEGEVTQVQRSGESLPTQESEFVMEATLSAGTADELAVGDEFSVSGDTVAEITALEQFPREADDGESGERAVLIGVSATTIERGGTVQFAGQTLRVGNTVPFESDGYDISGEIIQRGTGDIATEKRPFVIETTVPATTADDIREGDEFRLGGETIVSVESTTVYTTDDADTRRVLLGVSAATREDDGTVLFGDSEVRLGTSIPVETGDYDISGEVIRRGSFDEPGEQATRTVTLGADNIRPDRAAAIEEGQIEQSRDLTTAEVLSKSAEPAEVILESDAGEIFSREHPRNLDVELEVELTVRELDDGTVRFRGDPLRSGDTLTLDFGSHRIEGDVKSITE